MLPDQTGTIDATEATFDHATERFAEEWREQLAAMRGTCPVAHTDAHGGFYAVSRYADVQSALRDYRTFSSDRDLDGGTWSSEGGATIPRNRGRLSFMEMDPPESVAFRRLVSQWFSRLAIDAYRPRLREIIGWAFDRVSDRGSTDVVTDLANPIPAIVTMDFLGIDLREWHLYGDAIHSGARRAPGSGQKLKVMMHEVDELVSRTDLHQDGLIAHLLRAEVDGRPLDRDIAREIIFTLLNGGIDTTTSMIASSVVQIDAHPDARELLRNDPGAIPTTVQELLRYCAPATGAARTVTAETEIEGVALHPGERVLLLLSSANFDESSFVDADRLDPCRAPNTHVSFGFGPHRCLGAELATAELEIFVAELIARMPDFTVDRAAVTPYPTIPLVNGYVSVPIMFSPRPPGHVAGDDIPRLTAPRLAPAR